MEKQGYVYIIGNNPNGVLYIGVTSNLSKRIYEHKHGTYKGFTSKYNCEKLYYYEVFEDIYAAITYEKRLKSWKRKWKEDLIESKNPDWNDLYESVIENFF